MRFGLFWLACGYINLCATDVKWLRQSFIVGNTFVQILTFNSFLHSICWLNSHLRCSIYRVYAWPPQSQQEHFLLFFNSVFSSTTTTKNWRRNNATSIFEMRHGFAEWKSRHSLMPFLSNCCVRSLAHLCLQIVVLPYNNNASWFINNIKAAINKMPENVLSK